MSTVVSAASSSTGRTRAATVIWRTTPAEPKELTSASAIKQLELRPARTNSSHLWFSAAFTVFCEIGSNPSELLGAGPWLCALEMVARDPQQHWMRLWHQFLGSGLTSLFYCLAVVVLPPKDLRSCCAWRSSGGLQFFSFAWKVLAQVSWSPKRFL